MAHKLPQKNKLAFLVKFRSIINWNVFMILLCTSVLSVVAVFPYVLTVQADIINQIPVPISSLFLIQLIQSAILFSVAIFLGLILIQKIHFSMPLLDALTRHKPYKNILRDMVYLAVPLGAVAALAIYVTDYFFTLGGALISTSESVAPVWQKLLASLYGGTTEEILMRLFLMSLFIWISMKVTRRSTPSDAGVVVSICLAAIIFGLGHMPITASMTEITSLVVLRAIVLNGIGGVIFGWLYWKKGIESAMIAHFTADIFLLTILPLLVHY